LQDAFIPFISPYRPLWLGLGAIALDLLIALTVTSLLRARLGHRSWRLVHWTAYLCWPLAVLHGLGTGSDTRTRWVLVVTLLCVAAIAGLPRAGPRIRGSAWRARSRCWSCWSAAARG
jgi:methionine sulfoxide reductase heme-binding subunit